MQSKQAENSRRDESNKDQLDMVTSKRIGVG
jgi:hypothetical protein